MLPVAILCSLGNSGSTLSSTLPAPGVECYMGALHWAGAWGAVRQEGEGGNISPLPHSQDAPGIGRCRREVWV